MLCPFDDLLLRLATDRGLLSPARADSARTACAADPAGAANALLALSVLDRPALAALLEAEAVSLAAADPVRFARAQYLAASPDPATRNHPPGTDPSHKTAPVALAPPLAHGRRFGKFEIVRELGHGGMGAVYQAWHPGLRTHFALKVLLAGPDAPADHAARFMREAQALARLDHPGLVKVHDIGEDDGRTWFAMEYVEGETVADLIARTSGPLPSAEAIALVRDAAEAIHAAHRAGVLHRDLKPANLLRDRAGRLKVMDFGLAKLLDSGPSSTTRTRQIMGTPPYLSPEHVDGGMKEVDAQSDVYQLGATLYELLTGHRPYHGSAAEILVRISRDDPPRPRSVNPRVDPCAEAVCLAAMAREKSRRYPDAAALAEDCRRCLAGEPLVARPETVAHRALRWVSRRPASAAALAVLVACAGLAAALAWHARALEAEVLDALRETARASVEAVLAVRRAGGRMPEARARFLPPLEDAARRALEISPDLAEPHRHLGRLYRALLRFDDALAEQERALAVAPDDPECLYERIVLRSRRYGDRVAELRERWLRQEGRSRVDPGALVKSGFEGWARTDPPADDVLAEDDARARALREAVLADLERIERGSAGFTAAGGAPAEGPSDSGGGAPAGGAGGGGPSAPGGAPLPPSALACARGIALSYRSGTERDQARALLRAALEQDPAREEASEALVRLERASGADAEAVAVLDRAIAADAGYVPLRVARGEARAALARRPPPGSDPSPFREAALADFGKALDLEPTTVEAWSGRGNLRLAWGLALEAQEQDPEKVWAEAAGDFDERAKLSPDAVEALLARETLQFVWGAWRESKGRDPTPQLGLAIADLDRLIELDPDRLEVWLDRGEARRHWAAWLDRGAGDPFPQLEQAAQDFAEAVKRAPDDALPRVRRGCLRMDHAVSLQRRGKPCDALLDQALEDFTRASELEPKSVEPWWRRANILSFRASMAMAQRQDPEPLFAAGIESLRIALGLDPRHDVLWEVKGMHLASWAGFRTRRNLDAEPQMTEAVAAYDRAIEIVPTRAAAYRGRGEVWANGAMAQLRRRQDGRERLDRAEADFTKALELDPADARAWILRGNVRRDRVMSEGAPMGEESPLWRAALGDFDQGVERAREGGRERVQRARFRCLWASLRLRRGEDVRALTDAARADFDAVLAHDPRDVEALLGRGEMHYLARSWAEAVADLEAAMRLAPVRDPYLAQILAESRSYAQAASAGEGEDWRALAERGGRAVAEGRYVAARSDYAQALILWRKQREAAPELERAKLEEGARETLQTAHVHLARIYALASVGKDSPAAPGGALPEADAAGLRDVAFEHLGEALRLGFAERERLGAEEDLAPLRSDPRWREVLDPALSGR